MLCSEICDQLRRLVVGWNKAWQGMEGRKGRIICVEWEKGVEVSDVKPTQEQGRFSFLHIIY